MRWVLDTNVVASGLLWTGVPRQLLHAARAEQVRLFTSASLLAELAEILGRHKFAKKIAASGFSMDQLIERYAALATAVRPAPLSPVIAADPDDDCVLACALAAQADAIVSGDTDLLALKSHQGIPILTASRALDNIKHKA